LIFAPRLRESGPIKLKHLLVVFSDDQQRSVQNTREGRTGQSGRPRRETIAPTGSGQTIKVIEIG
jgi:hypothetical protein